MNYRNRTLSERRSTYIFLAVITLFALSAIYLFIECTKSVAADPREAEASILINPVEKAYEAILSQNQKQFSKFAYVTLLSGIDSSFKYRGFLYNVLIMKRALIQSGSVADLIALIGLSEKDTSPFEADFKLLQDAGVILHILPRFLDESHELGFAEMALLKITPWSFTQYDRLQFFDGDIMPLQNMDCFFQLDANSFTVGAVSPLNSGWFLAIPSTEAYNYMKGKSIWRLGRDWDTLTGWGEKMPDGLMYRGGKMPCLKWQFNGADMDQGLLLHYFVINKGNALLMDTETKLGRFFEQGLLAGKDDILTARKAYSVCDGVLPTAKFAHFTGRSKPWMVEEANFKNARKGGSLSVWIQHLDSLNLPVNSSNILSLALGSPLGFFNAGFPKGGFKNKASKEQKLILI